MKKKIIMIFLLFVKSNLDCSIPISKFDLKDLEKSIMNDILLKADTISNEDILQLINIFKEYDINFYNLKITIKNKNLYDIKKKYKKIEQHYNSKKESINLKNTFNDIFGTIIEEKEINVYEFLKLNYQQKHEKHIFDEQIKKEILFVLNENLQKLLDKDKEIIKP